MHHVGVEVSSGKSVRFGSACSSYTGATEYYIISTWDFRYYRIFQHVLILTWDMQCRSISLCCHLDLGHTIAPPCTVSYYLDVGHAMLLPFNVFHYFDMLSVMRLKGDAKLLFFTKWNHHIKTQACQFHRYNYATKNDRSYHILYRLLWQVGRQVCVRGWRERKIPTHPHTRNLVLFGPEE